MLKNLVCPKNCNVFMDKMLQLDDASGFPI